MAMCGVKEILFCGKHGFVTNIMGRYRLHIIDEHDTEHGLYQQVGKPATWMRDGKPWYGNFRYLYVVTNSKIRPYDCWDRTGHELKLLNIKSKEFEKMTGLERQEKAFEELWKAEYIFYNMYQHAKQELGKNTQ